MHFLTYLFNNPMFGACFIFSTIPAWVPAVGLLAGFDPVLMILLLVMSLISQAYIDSEVTFTNHLVNMFDYLLTNPFQRLVKLSITLLILFMLVIYGEEGTEMDRWIAAVMMVFVVKTMYFNSTKSGYWNIKGLHRYQFGVIGGKILIIFFWLSFFMLEMPAYEKAAIAITAMFLSALTFLKKNEGLI